MRISKSKLTRNQVKRIVKSARKQNKRPDLRQANLSGVGLSSIDLREADLSGATLKEANLMAEVERWLSVVAGAQNTA